MKIEDLTETDLAALQLALDLTLADDPPDPGRVEQVQSKLEDCDWFEVAKFCAYHQQSHRLNCHPAQSPPCWIVTAEEANAILKKGPREARDGSGKDLSNCTSAQLLKRMLRAGISPFHPNPLAALEAVKA